MATKKKSGKKPRGKKILVGTDPPVMVGGGGSAFIWIAKDADPQLIDPTKVPGQAPQPPNPTQYYCFQIQKNVGKLDIDTGDGSGSSNKGANGNKFAVKFQQ